MSFIKKLLAGTAHLFTGHIFPWVKHVVSDAKSWVTFILTSCMTSATQWLAGLDINAIQAWHRREWALRMLVTFGPGILTALATGRPHQSAEDIAKKIAALSPEERAKLQLGTDVAPPS